MQAKQRRTALLRAVDHASTSPRRGPYNGVVCGREKILTILVLHSGLSLQLLRSHLSVSVDHDADRDLSSFDARSLPWR